MQQRLIGFCEKGEVKRARERLSGFRGIGEILEVATNISRGGGGEVENGGEGKWQHQIS